MLYDLAIVTDTGKYYTVIGTIKEEIDNILNNENKYLKLSYNAVEKIKQGLEDNKRVVIIKELISEEVLPGEVIIEENEENDDLSILKEIAIQKIHKESTK